MMSKEQFVSAIKTLKPRILALAPGKKPDLSLRRTLYGYEVRLSWVERGNGHPQTYCVSQVFSEAFFSEAKELEEQVLDCLSALVEDVRSTL